MSEWERLFLEYFEQVKAKTISIKDVCEELLKEPYNKPLIDELVQRVEEGKTLPPRLQCDLERVMDIYSS